MKDNLLDKNEIKNLIQMKLISKGIIGVSSVITKEYVENIVYKKTGEYLNENKKGVNDIIDDKYMEDLDSEKCGKSAKYIVNSMSNAINKFNTLYDEYEGYIKEIDDWYQENIFEKHKKNEYTKYLLDDEYESSDEGQAVLSFTHAVEGHRTLGLKRVHDILNKGDRDVRIKDDINMLLDTDSYNTTEKLTGSSDLYDLRFNIKKLFQWYNSRDYSYADKTTFEEIKNTIDITNTIPGFEHQKEFINVIEKMEVPLKSIQLNTAKLVDKLHINVANSNAFQVDTPEDVGYALEGDNKIDVTPFYESL